MANTRTATELVVTKFLKQYYREYVRRSRFTRYTGMDHNNVIVIKEGRKKIEIPLVTRLKGDGTSGSKTLRGNGEAIGNYGQELAPSYKRHAVEFDKEELEKPAIDLMRAARPLLLDWSMEKTRDDVIKAMAAMHDGTAYREIAAVTEAQADLWAAQNDDRILFGSALANSSGDHSADLAKVDTTNDTLDRGIVGLAKRMAKNANPHIRPIRIGEDEEWYVMFVDSYAFRDLKTDMATEHASAMQRGKSNPIYKEGDLVYDSVIIREIPEIGELVTNTNGTLSTINLLTGGASSARVAPCFFCGAQALGYGLGQRPKIIVDKLYDYGFQPGVAVELKHDIKKTFFDDNPSETSSQHVQNGMVTVYVAAAVDS